MLTLFRLVALGAGLLMILNARADKLSDAPSTLICTMEHSGIVAQFEQANGGLFAQSGNSTDALLVTIQPESEHARARITIVSSLPSEAKALFVSAAKGQSIGNEELRTVRAMIADHSTQILVPLADDGSLSWQGEMYDQLLHIHCLPK